MGSSSTYVFGFVIGDGGRMAGDGGITVVRKLPLSLSGTTFSASRVCGDRGAGLFPAISV